MPRKKRERTLTVSCRLEERLFAELVYYYHIFKGRPDLTRSKMVELAIASFVHAIRPQLPPIDGLTIQEVLHTTPVEVEALPSLEEQPLDLQELKSAFLKALIEEEQSNG